MRVLITGSTANQTNPVTHQRSINFVGLMHEALSYAGVQVFWQRPEDVEDLSSFDKVLVGLYSPMAMGSYRVYGALRCIDELLDTDKLVLYLDAPDPNSVIRGFNSVCRDPNSLFKPFFEKRPEYNSSNKDKLVAVCERLFHDEWPRTIVPALPWTNSYEIVQRLNDYAPVVSPVNLDSFVLNRFSHATLPRENSWVVDKNFNKRWFANLALANPVHALYENHRDDVHERNITELGSALGYLHSPNVRGDIWWTPRIAMSLSQRTPVFTNWRRSQVLGSSWATLPGTFEVMTSNERAEIAEHQYADYVASIPSITEASEILISELGDDK